jgi:hypothetical protein
MPDADYFQGRAVAYRQLAINAKDEMTAGNLFEIAGGFHLMAAELRALELPRAHELVRPALFDTLRGFFPAKAGKRASHRSAPSFKL